MRTTTVQTAIAKANEILHPYTLDVKDVAWYSVYEVAHRLTDKFDEVPTARACPHVFITGDACHTHSAKAGQGMNVSMQDGFNLGWKLAHVLTGRSPESLLKTYSAERQVIAKNLIDFDREWSTLMAKKPEEFSHPRELGEFYVRTREFPAGFMTQYAPSMVIAIGRAPGPGEPASGSGKRFKIGSRRAGLRRQPRAPRSPCAGRRALASVRLSGDPATGARLRRVGRRAFAEWAAWLEESPESPVRAFTPEGTDLDSLFDVKVVYPERHVDIDLGAVPPVFLPRIGRFGLIDYEKVYAADPADDIHELRGIDRETGCVVVVRPDQYVAAVLPFTARTALVDFFAGFLREVPVGPRLQAARP